MFSWNASKAACSHAINYDRRHVLDDSIGPASAGVHFTGTAAFTPLTPYHHVVEQPTDGAHILSHLLGNISSTVDTVVINGREMLHQHLSQAAAMTSQ